MALKLMYITNKPQIAKIAEEAGVDRIFIDLEMLGKVERQGHLDSVISHHSIDDIRIIRSCISRADLLVRVNPINKNSFKEINEVISNGADIVMLPMFQTPQEVIKFINYVSGRAKTMLLLETKEAVENIDEILRIDGIDEIHIGLNDMHLAYKKNFMFELFIDGTVSYLASKLNEKNYSFGIGGIARIGYGLVPAEYIIGEHYRLGSKGAILSRTFCNANNITNPIEITNLFKEGVLGIRECEANIINYSNKNYQDNYKILEGKIINVIRGLR